MKKGNVFTVDELIAMNETMLGRGMPIQNDGIGYNKADYDVCANYYYGLSNAQIADLARRLVKYSETQLHIDKEMMKETAEYYASLAKNKDRSDGISISVMENETLVSFKYNEDFIEVIRRQPERRWDSKSKQWVVPNSGVISVLEKLKEVGADVDNAIEYAKNHEFIVNAKPNNKTNVALYYLDKDTVVLKFDYNPEIINKIKEKIDKEHRKWNAKYKCWIISKNKLEPLIQSLKDLANFKIIKQE